MWKWKLQYILVMQLWRAFSCLISLCTCVGTVSAGVFPYGQAAMGEGKGIARHRCDIRNSSDQEKTHSD
jgi:hypothetical protein